MLFYNHLIGYRLLIHTSTSLALVDEVQLDQGLSEDFIFP